jgi:hypothetical protein
LYGSAAEVWLDQAAESRHTRIGATLTSARHSANAGGECAMSQENPIRLFVSHLFQTDDDYLRLFEYLESASNFYYKNLSAPDKAPRSPEKEALKEELRRQMADAEVIVVLASQFERNQILTEFQALYGKACDRPVIVVEPFGATQPVPRRLRDLADEVVPWNERGLVDAVRRQARHEETTRWDVVEFKLD